jgi:GntR family transcriptional regulator, transcriptional repressor for pyruvate dehydrogenase complex
VLTNLSRETLAEQIAQRLVQFIESQELQPGELLPSESKLSEDFGVSRPVVREALKALAAQDVIQIVGGKGAIVRPIDDKLLRLFFTRAIQFDRATLMQLMEVRASIEVQSAMLAAQRRTTEELARILDTVQAMRSCLDDQEVYANLDVEFHLLIAAATHNPVLYHLISSIRDSLKHAIREGLRRRDTKEQLERVQVLHEMIATAIERGQNQEAGQAMTQHVGEAVQWIGV